MKFEDKIQLAVEMAHFRIEAEAGENGVARLIQEKELPRRGKQGADLYSECVHEMFLLIEKLETEHNQ